MNGGIHVGRVRGIGCYCTQGALIYHPGFSYFPKKYRPAQSATRHGRCACERLSCREPCAQPGSPHREGQRE